MRIVLSLALVLLTAACATPRDATAPAGPVTVGILAINDFHGALEPPRQSAPASDGNGGTVAVPAGGAAWLASAVDSIKIRYPNHVVVAAGDLTSASQLASSLFLDEPAIGVMNRIGLEFNAVGNHEFDRGWQELQRLQNGGCDRFTAIEPCQLEQFAGAGFKYLSASTYRADGSTLFPATGLKSFGEGEQRVTIGLIGLSLKGVPDLVSASAIRGLSFGDEAEAINRAVPLLKQQGADAVVVLIHQGGRTAEGGTVDGCNGFAGAIEPILRKLDPRVDLVVSGHTHWAYVCDWKASEGAASILLTSAGVYGEVVTDITLVIDPAADRVLSKSARNVIVQSPGYSGGRGEVFNTSLVPAFDPRADVTAYVKQYIDAAKDVIARPVGQLAGPVEKTSGIAGNTGGPLGNLIADAQLAATRDAGAQIALTNPFGIRTSLVPGANGEVTFGQLYAVQPFGNTLVTMTMTGAQIERVVEDGLDFQAAPQVLVPSADVRLRYDLSRPVGSRLSSLTFKGKPLDKAASYRVTVNNFLSEGGDGFATFRQGTDKTNGGVDLDAFIGWLSAVPMRAVPAEQRTIAVRN